MRGASVGVPGYQAEKERKYVGFRLGEKKYRRLREVGTGERKAKMKRGNPKKERNVSTEARATQLTKT